MKPANKPVLRVVSSHSIKGASDVPTGFFMAELTLPINALVLGKIPLQRMV